MDQSLNLNLPSAASAEEKHELSVVRETAMKALSLPIPEPSIRARRRSVPQSTPLQAEKKKAKLQSSDNGNSQLITVTADDRVNEFPDSYLEARKGKLFCLACRENISLKASAIFVRQFCSNLCKMSSPPI